MVALPSWTVVVAPTGQRTERGTPRPPMYRIGGRTPFRVDAGIYTIVKVWGTSAHGTRGEPMSLAAQIWVALAITLHILVLSWACDALVRFLFGEDDR